MTALQERPTVRKLPSQIWQDFQRCRAVIKSTRCYLLLNYLATIRRWITPTHINAVPGLGYKTNNGACAMMKRWADAGILISQPNPHPMARGQVYTLSPKSAQLLGIPPITTDPDADDQG